MTSEKKIPIIEIFGPTLQGEGPLIGTSTYFIRTGGCPLRCAWCDTMYAVDPEQVKENTQKLSTDEIIEQVKALDGFVKIVTITGGEPCMWDLTELVLGLQREGFEVAVETAGTLWQGWLEDCDIVVVSPKGPSSGMLDKLSKETLTQLCRLDNMVIKVVVFTEEDLDFAEDMMKTFGDHIYLTPGTPNLGNAPRSTTNELLFKYRELVEIALKKEAFKNVTILPQMHVLLWGHRRGV